MADREATPQAQMMQLILSKWVSQPISLVSRLGIPDLLAAGPSSVEALAESTGAHADSLYRIMRALAAVGVFREGEARVFELTPLGECLETDGLRFQAMLFHSPWHDRAWSELEHSVRTGEAAFEKAFGKPAFEWLAEHPTEAQIHGRAMAANLAARTEAVVSCFDFARFERVVDVGCGQGALLAAIAAKHPMLRGVGADLPHAARAARERFVAGGIADRCSAQDCDFMQDVPAGGDLYILCNVLHDWDDERCEAILGNCGKAMQAGGGLLVVEFLIPPGNEFSPAKLLDLEMMVMSDGGRERTEDEYRGLLEAAGFELEQIVPLPTGEVIMEARER
jgi:cyclopropane fatty-acyl-phospholipid synthase-like methyltransferase